ncbi:phage tail assembly chaperone [Variovorax sp. H27-G14]|uniref:phage tail assembly chaperone n=1 Tax=Variovorax sp. H27-G14 TaxID=3111914 RepID=UPI0038FD2474
MAVKITLGNRPKSFTKKVEFPMLDGTTGAINITYKHRTRSEFGAFIDEILDAAGEKKKADGDDEKFSMAALMKKTGGANSDYILKVVDAWDLEADLTPANVQQLADELPAATNAIMETYRIAITEGRLGN